MPPRRNRTLTHLPPVSQDSFWLPERHQWACADRVDQRSRSQSTNVKRHRSSKMQKKKLRRASRCLSTAFLTLDESQQVGVDRVRLRGWHAMREVLIGLERPVLQQLCRQGPSIGVGNDLIVLAMHH